MKVHEVLARLTGVKRTGANQWVAFCPCCEPDKTRGDRHLGVSEGNNEKPLFNCLHYCCFQDIVKAVESRGCSGLAHDHRKRGNKKPGGKRMGKTWPSIEAAVADLERTTGGQCVGNWEYPGGTFRVLRFDLAEDDKTFRPVHRNGAGWVLGDPPGLLPLYRADALPADGLVWVVEGEGTADALLAIRVPCVTSAHGAGSPGKSDWAPLAGRDVAIWPDTNKAGYEYAEAVAAMLTQVAPPARADHGAAAGAA